MEKKEKKVKREMVEKISDKFLGTTTNFLGFKRFASPSRDILDNSEARA